MGIRRPLLEVTRAGKLMRILRSDGWHKLPSNNEPFALRDAITKHDPRYAAGSLRTEQDAKGARGGAGVEWATKTSKTFAGRKVMRKIAKNNPDRKDLFGMVLGHNRIKKRVRSFRKSLAMTTQIPGADAKHHTYNAGHDLVITPTGRGKAGAYGRPSHDGGRGTVEVEGGRDGKVSAATLAHEGGFKGGGHGRAGRLKLDGQKRTPYPLLNPDQQLQRDAREVAEEKKASITGLRAMKAHGITPTGADGRAMNKAFDSYVQGSGGRIPQHYRKFLKKGGFRQTVTEARAIRIYPPLAVLLLESTRAAREFPKLSQESKDKYTEKVLQPGQTKQVGVRDKHTPRKRFGPKKSGLPAFGSDVAEKRQGSRTLGAGYEKVVYASVVGGKKGADAPRPTALWKARHQHNTRKLRMKYRYNEEGGKTTKARAAHAAQERDNAKLPVRLQKHDKPAVPNRKARGDAETYSNQSARQHIRAMRSMHNKTDGAVAKVYDTVKDREGSVRGYTMEPLEQVSDAELTSRAGYKKARILGHKLERRGKAMAGTGGHTTYKLKGKAFSGKRARLDDVQVDRTPGGLHNVMKRPGKDGEWVASDPGFTPRDARAKTSRLDPIVGEARRREIEGWTPGGKKRARTARPATPEPLIPSGKKQPQFSDSDLRQQRAQLPSELAKRFPTERMRRVAAGQGSTFARGLDAAAASARRKPKLSGAGVDRIHRGKAGAHTIMRGRRAEIFDHMKPSARRKVKKIQAGGD